MPQAVYGRTCRWDGIAADASTTASPAQDSGAAAAADDDDDIGGGASSAPPQELQQEEQQEQQQQQQQRFKLPLGDPIKVPELEPHEFCYLQPQLVQPLVLSLLQLCAELKSGLNVIAQGLLLVNEILSACVRSAAMIERAAELRHTTVVTLPDGTAELVCDTAPFEPMPAVIQMRRAYQQALHAMVQPLLHAVCPIALKAVQQIEQGLSRGVVSSSIRVGPGFTAEQAALDMVYKVMGAFGRIVLQLIGEGEPGSSFCTSPLMLMWRWQQALATLCNMKPLLIAGVCTVRKVLSASYNDHCRQPAIMMLPALVNLPCFLIQVHMCA
jgi:hypothetical protein